MGKIIDIEQFINDLKDRDTKLLFLNGYAPLEQRGQTCKLVAGISAQNYLYTSKFNSQAPLPLHKNHIFNYSLRQGAKQLIGSKVGEVYGTGQFKKIFEYNGFEVKPFRIYQEEIYINLIKDSIKNSCPVIAFFDVIAKNEGIKNNGSPALLNGKFEHAAVIIGFYKKNHEYHLIYSQWDGFYDCSARSLFQSTSQLKRSKNSESYKKVAAIPFLFSKSQWISEQQVKDTLDIIYTRMPIKKFMFSNLFFCGNKMGNYLTKNRRTNPPIGIEGSFANTIAIITGDNMNKDFLSKYKDFFIRDDSISLESPEEEKLLKCS